MAEKVMRGKSDGSNKNLLIMGLLFIVLAIGGTIYEITRPRTADELKDIDEQKKIQADIDRANKGRRP